MKGSFFRLFLGLFICLLFLGMMTTTGPEESEGCSGHESGELTVINKLNSFCYVNLMGPFQGSLSLNKDDQRTIKIRAGVYNWIAINRLGELGTGMVTVNKNKTTVLNIPLLGEE